MTEQEIETIKYGMYRDIAIKDAKHFNFDSYTNAISKIILDKDNKTPFSIAINGKWGSGKTTLMKTLREKLIRQSGKRNNRKVKTVWFDAWKYSETDSMLAALILELFEEMGREGIKSRLKTTVLEGSERINLLKQMTDLAKILTLGHGPEFDKWVKNPAYIEKLSFYDLFQDYLEKILLSFVLKKEEGEYTDTEGVLVIFIDDLDRCPPKNITQVLESINLFLDQEGCFFIFGTDISLISKAIEVEYKDFGISGSDYIKKMIHLRFNLPAIREEDIKKFMSRELKIAGPLKKYFDMIAQGLESNQREIKRFLNSLNLMRMLGNSIKNLDIMEELLIKWTILTFSSEDFINEVKKNHVLLIDMQSISKMKKKERENFLETLPEYDKKLYNRFIIDKKILNVLKIGKEQFEEADVPNYIFLSSVAPKEPEEGTWTTEEEITGPRVVKGYRIEPAADLRRADLSNDNLAGANLRRALLMGADLRNADLVRASLVGADLEGADLRKALLRDASIYGANLEGANLMDADLGEADLVGTILIDADLRRADLVRAHLMETNLERADLERANLRGANLTSADLNRANFKQTIFDEYCLETILKSNNWKTAEFDPEVRNKLEDMEYSAPDTTES